MTFAALLGYAASAVIAVSLMLVSVVRLRIVNLAGSALFAVYGVLIDALPIVALNILMVGVNGFHLARLLGADDEVFELLRVPSDSPYLGRFLAHHAEDVDRFAPGFELHPDTLCVFVLRDAVPSGLLVAVARGDTLEVALDYAIPSFRDLKAGTHLYERLPSMLGDTEVERIVSKTSEPSHERYFRRMGFERRGDVLVRPLTPSERPPRSDRRPPGAPPR